VPTKYTLHRSLRHTRRLGSLAEQVYTALRERIISRDLAPDTRLTELDIASDFGTSQGPVRDALQMLEQECLLERRSGRTMHVTTATKDEIHGFSMVRKTIEQIAIKKTAENILDDQLKVLKDLVKAMQDAAANHDGTSLVQYDMEFHRLICQWSGSPVLVGAWIPLYSQIQRFILENHRTYFANLNELADSHQPILDAIESHDPELASQLVQEHIDYVWKLKQE